jgi:hypothetical protein
VRCFPLFRLSTEKQVFIHLCIIQGDPI